MKFKHLLMIGALAASIVACKKDSTSKPTTKPDDFSKDADNTMTFKANGKAYVNDSMGYVSYTQGQVHFFYIGAASHMGTDSASVMELRLADDSAGLHINKPYSDTTGDNYASWTPPKMRYGYRSDETTLMTINIVRADSLYIEGTFSGKCRPAAGNDATDSVVVTDGRFKVNLKTVPIAD